MATIHIRITRRSGRDARTRGHRFDNASVPTLCGTASTHEDTGVDYARALEANWRPVLHRLKPTDTVHEYFRDLCPACLEQLRTRRLGHRRGCSLEWNHAGDCKREDGSHA